MPQHHLPDDTLLAYAAGALGESESLLVACHITLCPSCRHTVDVAEQLGAAVLESAAALESAAPAPRSPSPAGAALERRDAALLADLLPKLDDRSGSAADERAASAPAAAIATDPTGIVPAPLFDLVGDLDRAPWQRKLPSLHILPLPPPADDKLVSLVRLAPGASVPLHAHRGTEAALVLTGGFTDDAGHFVRGDVSVRDDSKLHKQRIDAGEPCIWLLVADGPFIPRSLTGWLARLLFGL
ncbi:MAG: ChrR family anti-sigma-E factor [Haliangiales bacterium]